MSPTARDVLVPTLLLLSLAAGCAAEPPGKAAAAEEGLPLDGKLDSFQKPTDHGVIGFGALASQAGKLTKKELHHVWDFSLAGPADVHLFTGAPPADADADEVDTVMYLYRESDRGWGSWIARNDDANGALWSSVVRSLGAGHYRVLVKGYAASTRGSFGVTIDCDGDGCGAVPVSECLLGDTYNDFRNDPAFQPMRSARLTSAQTLSQLERQQVVIALHQSSHTDVTTAEEAFEAADSNEINLTEVRHVPTGNDFIAFEYGAGDNSYGAVFWSRTVDLAASIHDGDLLECSFLAAPGGVQQGQDCAAFDACATGLTCLGMTGGHGKCVPTSNPTGEGQPCSSTVACPGTQLVCAGLTRGDAGMCLPFWLRGSFDDAGPFAIPDGAAAGLTRHVTAYGLATVDMDVEVRATIMHARASQLRVTLENPAGTVVVLFDGATADPSVDEDTYLEIDGGVLGFSGDEQVNGTWTLNVIDSSGGNAGQLSSWHLTVTSRWD